MESPSEYELNYETKRWSLERFDFLVGENDEIKSKLEEVKNSDLVVCDSDSDRAKELGENPKRFYRDYEMIAAGFDSITNMNLYRLKEDWKDFKKDSLVIETFNRDLQPHFTYIFQI